MKLHVSTISVNRAVWRKLIKNECASAAVEAAFVLPVFIAVFFGVIEFSRMMLIQQKLENTVSAMGDFVTQGEYACSADMSQFRTVAKTIMSPFNFTDSSITFTSLVNYNNNIPPCPAGVTCISWQDGSYSKIGTTGDTPTNLPGGLVVTQGHNYIITELKYRFEPLLGVSGRFIPGIGAKDVYLINIHKPRTGSLNELNPPECNGG